MKAIIYNSGLGKRMGDYTKFCPKSMVKLLNGETIFERQLRVLVECGINDIIVTTGPFKEQLEEVCKKKQFSDVNFTFVQNDIYSETNYIYSMYLAKDYLDDDVLSLHGDLVFNKNFVKKIINDKRESLIAVNRTKKLPEKDFKGRIKDGKLQEVSISIFDPDCFAVQPFYKLAKKDILAWVKKVEEFINNGVNKVYAENAFNEILPQLSVEEFSYENDYIDEIDTPDDLKRVANEIRYYDYAEQVIEKSLSKITEIFKKEKAKKVFVVSTSLFDKWPLKQLLIDNKIDYFLFDKYEPNPKYDDVLLGVKAFNTYGPDIIVSLGGGSSIDVAKAIKLFFSHDLEADKMPKEYSYNSLKHIAIPTTAGTGSESTRFSVIYLNGVKQSLTHDTIIPDYVILEPNLLLGLPDYQKKATILDALCQGIESFWSVNSTDDSIKYSKEAIKIILANIKSYILSNDIKNSEEVLYASNLAGKAINITQTTAAHALSYKLTSLYGIAHGQAVAITLPYVWEYISNNLDNFNDKRGLNYLKSMLTELNGLFNTNNTSDSIAIFNEIYKMMNFKPIVANDKEVDILVENVNPDRLNNNPVKLKKEDIRKIYSESLR